MPPYLKDTNLIRDIISSCMLFIIRIIRDTHPFWACMKNHSRRFISVFLTFILLNSICVFPASADSFTVSEIKIEGLNRLPDGTLLNYLPIVVGDPIDDNQITFSISELYKTGFFADVKLLRDDNALIVRVKERPSIANVEFSGNSDIEDDTLNEALLDIGVARGKIYNRSLLEKLTLELERVYFSQGKYGVKIESDVTDLDQNRVDIEITISEGEVALIKHINIVGNDVFDDDTLLDDLESGVPSAWAVLSSADEYSKPKLNGDLEKIRSYYLDRGYIKFSVESTQVSLTPDKKDIYITVNVSEGDRYKISASELTGDFVVNRQTMKAQLLTKEGAFFSRSLMTSSKKRLTDQMGRIGYAFSEVKISPVIDDKKKEVSLTYHMIPGEKVYIRQINIHGNDSTQDHVYRREMRLMEGSILASNLLERSKIRVQRLPYIDSVDVESIPVAGSNNQVDIKVTVVEKLAGSFNIGAGYSQTQGLLFNIGLTQENLFGSGKRLAVDINTDSANTVYSAAFTDPYHTLDGISRTLSVSFRDRNSSEELINNFETTSGDFNVSYGIPLTEFNTLSLGYGYSHIKIKTSSVNPSQDVLDFIAENDDKTTYDNLTINAGFSHDTRNRTVFANAGTQHSLSVNATLPGSDLEYFKVTYVTNTYFKVTRYTTLLLRSNLAYGDGYGDTSELPFYERYFAGGIRTVRGFESNSLGPRDLVETFEGSGIYERTGSTIGGNMRATAGADYIFPIPFVEKPPNSVRFSAFLDIGNVFLTGVPTYDATNDETGFQIDQLRSSYGLSLVWLSPIGPLRFSYAQTINDAPDDDLRAFQFSIGSFF